MELINRSQASSWTRAEHTNKDSDQKTKNREVT